MRARLAIAVLCALLAAAAVSAGELGSEAEQAEGKGLYDKYCAQCHGLTGDGIGYATYRVKPQPRDFTSGKYKFRTTPNGMLPTDEDLIKVIRKGLPYTSMPGWPKFTDDEVLNIIYYIKTFSDDFGNPDKEGQPIEIPEPPAITEESVVKGREVYELQGCAACHGNLGRGDGRSGPTLKDDWGSPIRAADMTMRWTFRGGPTRKDIFRTFSTGVDGTPMPSYFDSVAAEDRWDLVNYIYSLGESDDPGYENLMLVTYVEDELDLERSDELFATAPVARFPLVGQIMEPGREFYPSTTSVLAQAIYNRNEIAFRIRWNDMRSELAGTNSPLLEVPPFEDPEPPAPEGDEAVAEDEGDFWGDEAVGEGEGEDEDDFWGEEDDSAAAIGGEFSDAVALQFPTQLPTGIRKPYFLFGDTENPVDLWFVDLARGVVEQFAGRGSQSLTPAANDEFELTKSYDEGQWTVVFKRSLRSTGSVSFAAEQYVPIAFSVWDGFNEERGNKRALSAWFYLYVTPSEEVSAVGPMLRAGFVALVVELLVILFLRRRFAARAAA